MERPAVSMRHLLAHPVDPGQSQTTAIVWPDTGQDTVTVAYEYFGEPSNVPFRLTDIPVVDGE